MNNRSVGILVNSSLYRGIHLGKTHHEALHFYEEAGQLYNLTPCFFRLQDINPGQEQITAYVKRNSGYKKSLIPTPQIIHNRALYFTKTAQRKIDRLSKDGKTIFNQWNRYGKRKIHDLLMLDVSLRPHLPGTFGATMTSISEMMHYYPTLILKPNSSSIGRGVMKLHRQGGGWLLQYTTEKKGAVRRKIEFTDTIPSVIKRRIHAAPYIVQQCLPLATYHERPFDLRVSVQRNITGQWQITGIVGKVAKKEAFVTNVAKGGTVITLENLLEEYPHLNIEKVYNDIAQFALRAANHLGMYLPNLADLGFDVGITEHGFPMCIECNGRDLRYSFREGRMIQEWKATYANPIGYARYLMDGNLPSMSMDF